MFLGGFPQDSGAAPPERDNHQTMVLQKTKSCSRKLQNAMNKKWPGVSNSSLYFGGCRCTDFQDSGAVQLLQKNQELFKEVIECNKSFINCRKNYVYNFQNNFILFFAIFVVSHFSIHFYMIRSKIIFVYLFCSIKICCVGNLGITTTYLKLISKRGNIISGLPINNFS